MNTKEWIIKFDFRGEKGQGTSGTTTVFEGNTERTAEGYYRRGWTCAAGGRRHAAQEGGGTRATRCEKFRRLLEEKKKQTTEDDGPLNPGGK